MQNTEATLYLTLNFYLPLVTTFCSNGLVTRYINIWSDLRHCHLAQSVSHVFVRRKPFLFKWWSNLLVSLRLFPDERPTIPATDGFSFAMHEAFPVLQKVGLDQTNDLKTYRIVHDAVESFLHSNMVKYLRVRHNPELEDWKILIFGSKKRIFFF